MARGKTKGKKGKAAEEKREIDFFDDDSGFANPLAGVELAAAAKAKTGSSPTAGSSAELSASEAEASDAPPIPAKAQVDSGKTQQELDEDELVGPSPEATTENAFDAAAVSEVRPKRVRRYSANVEAKAANSRWSAAGEEAEGETGSPVVARNDDGSAPAGFFKLDRPPKSKEPEPEEAEKPAFKLFGFKLSSGKGKRGAGSTSSSADLEAALAGWKAETTSHEEVVHAMDKYIEGKMVHAKLESAVLSVVAHLGEAPANWHQFTIYSLSTRDEEDEGIRKGAGLTTLVSALLVLFQLFTAIGIINSTVHPACYTSDQCTQKGEFCKVDGMEGTLFNCQFCGDPDNRPSDLPSPFNSSQLKELCSGQSQTALATSWCEACVNPGTWNVDTLTRKTLWSSNSLAMGSLDMFTMIFASGMVGFAVAGEVKDITVCMIALAKVGKDLSAPMRIIVTILCNLRRWLVVPFLAMSIPAVVLARGGDSLSVLVHSVAILFILEIDNLAYSLGLAEFARAQMEKEGRVQLAQTEADGLAWSKMAHVFMVGVMLPFTVVNAADGESGSQILMIPLCGFVAVGIMEALVPQRAAAEIAVIAVASILKGVLAVVAYQVVTQIAKAADGQAEDA